MQLMKGWETFSFKKRSPVGILLLHGFTGSTSSVLPLGEFLARSGYNVEIPRLEGHGTRWEDLNKVAYTDWIKDVEIGLLNLKKRAKQIFVAGLSMGGALALYLIQKEPGIKGIILINHALLIHDLRMHFIPLVRHFLRSVPGISSDIKDPSKKEIAYDRTPVKGVYEMIKLLRLVKKDLARVTQPCLIFKSREDHVLPIKNATYTFDHIASKEKELIWLENSYHVATMDYDKKIIFQKSLEFIKDQSKC